MPSGVVVFAEQRRGQFRGAAFEVTRAGRGLADAMGGTLTAVVGGKGVAGIAGQLAAYGADRIRVAEHERCADYSPEGYRKALLIVIEQEQPAVVLLPATAVGKDLAPRVAARLAVGFASDCTALVWKAGRLEATRPVYAGKAFITVTFTRRPCLATLRPKVFPAGEPMAGREARIEPLPLDLSPGETPYRVLEIQAKGGTKPDQTEADIIVSGGRGLKGPENFKMIEGLADALGGVVGASRAVVDAGWRPHSEQVGQTGKTVSPTLYIACGISGAIQHLAGMRSSKVIVAINKDPEAPIFKVANYGIVGDVFEIVPALTQAVMRLKEGPP